MDGEGISRGTRTKELKVQLPVALHIKLHTLKALEGKPIYEAITEALELYFSTHAGALPPAEAEPRGATDTPHAHARDEPADISGHG